MVASTVIKWATFKGGVAWQILVNTTYDFFLTTTLKRIDFIKGSQSAVAFAKQTKVLQTLRFRVCCTHMNTTVVSSVVILYPIGPESGHKKDT